MARIRTVKPDLFRHEELFEAERVSGLPLRLAFIGLFTVADRDGRFKWRPRQLKLDVLPYDDIDFSRVLDALATRGFIVKYTKDGEHFGFIPTFTTHQVINNREKESELPPYEDSETEEPENTENDQRVDDACQTRHVPAQGEREGKGREKEGEDNTCRDSGELDEAKEVAYHLLGRIVNHKPNFKKPSDKAFDGWVNDIGKSLRIDGRTKQELFGCIEWIYTTKDGEFWIPNILSGKKLREKFDTMEAKMMNSREYRNAKTIKEWEPTNPMTGKPYTEEENAYEISF